MDARLEPQPTALSRKVAAERTVDLDLYTPQRFDNGAKRIKLETQEIVDAHAHPLLNDLPQQRRAASAGCILLTQKVNHVDAIGLMIGNVVNIKITRDGDDASAVVFPRADRDNFGQELGPVDYDFRWHVGDRVTLLSDGYFDFFDGGLQTITFGGFLTRPHQGSVYVGFRAIEGPISSRIVAASFNYRMSEKWIATLGTTYDFDETGNIGQSVDITRIGESFLFSLGFNADAGRDSVGVHVNLEPRFLNRSRRGRVGGAPIPPVGMLGLE